jgi:hypothetical protein
MPVNVGEFNGDFVLTVVVKLVTLAFNITTLEFIACVRVELTLSILVLVEVSLLEIADCTKAVVAI